MSEDGADKRDEEIGEPRNTDAGRLFQSGTDYWKAQLEFFKQLMIANLAAVAAFGALLSGFYADSPKEPVDPIKVSFIVVIFLLFMISLLISILAASEARGNILEMRNVKTEEQFSDLRAGGKGERKWAARIFMVGVGLLAVFTLIYAIL